MSVAAFTGAVLCGGASRRMGRDKALLEVDGSAMATRVAAALREAGAAAVIAVGGDERALGALGLDVRPDRWPREGPLAATITALSGATTDLVLIASCDLLRPSSDALRTTVGALVEQPGADVAVPTLAGRRQWTHAAWRATALPGLVHCFEQGERSLWRAAEGCAVHEVTGVDPDALADADEPDDLA